MWGRHPLIAICQVGIYTISLLTAPCQLVARRGQGPDTELAELDLAQPSTGEPVA